jgi:hypothetical protein
MKITNGTGLDCLFITSELFRKKILSKVEECQVNPWKSVHNPQWPPQVPPKILKI